MTSLSKSSLFKALTIGFRLVRRRFPDVDDEDLRVEGATDGRCEGGRRRQHGQLRAAHDDGGRRGGQRRRQVVRTNLLQIGCIRCKYTVRWQAVSQSKNRAFCFRKQKYCWSKHNRLFFLSNAATHEVMGLYLALRQCLKVSVEDRKSL